MINEEKTFKKFGYYSTNLKPKSHKRVVANCNKCGKERMLTFHQYRDLCVSCSLKGRKHSEETKQKMSGKNNLMYGKKHSEETKQKISKANSGKFGKKSPNWQGGISMGKYCSKFDNECRENNRNKFYNKCFLCGKNEIENGRKLSVHHIDYNKNQGCDNISWKLIPLCIKCHSKTSSKYLRDYYEELISRLLYIRELILEYNYKIDYRSI